MPNPLPTIEEEWEEFFAETFLPGCSDETKRGARAVFFAGAVSMLSIAMTINASNHIDLVKAWLLEGYCDEMKAFKMGATVAPPEGPCT